MDEKVKNVLEELAVPYEIVEHEKLYKASDRIGKEIDFKGAICCKNLLVKEQSGPQKGKLYLLCLAISKKADLKEVARKLGSARLTFATEEELMNNLGITSGNASIFNILQKPDTKVTFVIDLALLREKKVAFHPNDNRMSVLFAPKWIEEILKRYHAQYCQIDI